MGVVTGGALGEKTIHLTVFVVANDVTYASL